MAKSTDLDRIIEEQLKLAAREKPRKRQRRVKHRNIALALDAVIINEDGTVPIESMTRLVDSLLAKIAILEKKLRNKRRGVDEANQRERQTAEDDYTEWRPGFWKLQRILGTEDAVEKIAGLMSAQGMKVSRRTLYRQLVDKPLK